MFVYRQDVVDRVSQLANRGFTEPAISRLTGVHRRTVHRWIAHPPNREPITEPLAILPRESIASYAYLLGLYLGDGWIGKVGRTCHLRISLDRRYPGIVQAASAAVGAVMPGHAVRVRHHPASNLDIVICCSMNWPLLFPQHGKGRKHKRHIYLADWQQEITREHPRLLLRGLIHSDGSRFVARQPRRNRVYRYSRYCFRNYSSDIISIFCEHLD